MKAKGKASKGKRNSPEPLPEKIQKFDVSEAQSPEEMLLEDLKRIRALEKAKGKKKKSFSPLDALKSGVDRLLLFNFFLVLGLLVWLAVALIPHFASKNDVLLDPWLGLWQPFIQPALGVLMLGTIVQGTASFINKD